MEKSQLFKRLDLTFIGLFKIIYSFKNFYFMRRVYRQYRKKSISDISKDKTLIKFRQRQEYFFDKEASAPFSEDDKIVMLNIPLTVSSSVLILMIR